MPSSDPGRGTVLQQQLPAAPIRWWADTRPHSVIGDVAWEDSELTLDVRCSSLPGSAMVALRASLAGRDGPDGIHAEDELPGLWLSVQCGPGGQWGLAASAKSAGAAPFAGGALPAPLAPLTWHTLRLQANGSTCSAWVDGQPLAAGLPLPPEVPSAGWAGLGALDFGQATQYDRLSLAATSAACSAAAGAGAPVALQRCNAQSPGQAWLAVPVAGGGKAVTLALPGAPGPAAACLAVLPQLNRYGSNGVGLAPCNASRPEQQWVVGQDGSIATQGLHAAPVCLDVTANVYTPGSQLDVYGCQGTSNQRWTFQGGLLGNGDPKGFFCAGACK